MFKLAVVFVMLGWSTVSFAYIPPSQFILKTWVSKHSGTKSLRIRSVVSAMEKDKPSDVRFKDTTWFDPVSFTVKSLATDDQDRKLYRNEKTGDAASPLVRFLLSSDLGEVTRVLRERGIPIRTDEELLKLRTEAERRKAESESLMRWNGGMAWVVGTGLWMEKDSFLPLRLVYTSSDNQENDFRFEGVRSFRDFPYPKVVNLVKKGLWVLSSQLTDISADNESTSSRFAHSSSGESGFTETGNSASSSLRNLIRQYYESFR